MPKEKCACAVWTGSLFKTITVMVWPIGVTAAVALNRLGSALWVAPTEMVTLPVDVPVVSCNARREVAEGVSRAAIDTRSRPKIP